MQDKHYIAEDAVIYEGAIVKDSTLQEQVSVGNFSKVTDSILMRHVVIDRYNYVMGTTIGAHSYTGKNVTLIHASIGNFCSVSWNVSIGGANHEMNCVTTHSFLYNVNSCLHPESEPPAYDRFRNQPCVIGHDVWIGTGAIILRGVEVGTGAVIGAGSVVTKNVPPYAVVCGNPAKIIRYRFDEAVINQMLQLKWWDWPDKKIRTHFDFMKSIPTEDSVLKMMEDQECREEM